MFLLKTSKADGSSQRFLFDHRNRLVRVSSWDGSDNYIGRVDYHYDTFNRMVKREDRSDSQTVIDNYFAGYDGINPTLEFEKVGGGNATRQDLKHRYCWGPQVDQLFADEQISDVSQAGEVLWALPDHLGTIRDIAQFDGTSFEIVNHRRYDSFGNLTGQTDPNYSIAFGYTGKYFDAYSGLSYHWNRWYDPQLGKWISEDPISFQGGDANLYRYVGNGATLATDPSGLFFVSFFGGIFQQDPINDEPSEIIREIIGEPVPGTGGGYQVDFDINLSENAEELTVVIQRVNFESGDHSEEFYEVIGFIMPGEKHVSTRGSTSLIGSLVVAWRAEMRSAAERGREFSMERIYEKFPVNKRIQHEKEDANDIYAMASPYRRFKDMPGAFNLSQSGELVAYKVDLEILDMLEDFGRPRKNRPGRDISTGTLPSTDVKEPAFERFTTEYWDNPDREKIASGGKISINVEWENRLVPQRYIPDPRRPRESDVRYVMDHGLSVVQAEKVDN